MTPKRVEGTASGSSRSIGQDNISYRCKNEKEGCQWANLIYLRWILRRYGKWMAEFVRQVKNPYCFKVGKVAVSVGYSGDGVTFEQRMEHYLQTL